MNNKWKTWGYNLGSGSIKGVSTAVLAFFGAAGVNATGLVTMPNLDWRQLLVITFCGAIVGLFSQLNVTPLPPLDK